MPQRQRAKAIEVDFFQFKQYRSKLCCAWYVRARVRESA
jgi:hypothetical protein